MDQRVKGVAGHLGSMAVGGMLAIQIVSSHGVDLYSAWEHAYTGIKELWLAASIAGPIALLVWGAFKNAPKQKLLDFLKDPKAAEIAAQVPVTPKVEAVADALKTNGTH